MVVDGRLQEDSQHNREIVLAVFFHLKEAITFMVGGSSLYVITANHDLD